MHINTPEEDITFHDQVGYWLWEPATGLVLQSLTIPRGQAVLAAGRATPADDRLVLSAERGRTDNGIVSTEFLEYAFRTDAYRIEVTFDPDGSWSYVLETSLAVRGQEGLFNHRDTNRMVKVEEPQPNPLMRILAARAGPPAAG
jgi:hypothetical protein